LVTDPPDRDEHGSQGKVLLEEKLTALVRNSASKARGRGPDFNEGARERGVGRVQPATVKLRNAWA